MKIIPKNNNFSLRLAQLLELTLQLYQCLPWDEGGEAEWGSSSLG